MTLDELNNLDPQNIGNWPLPIKIAIIVAVIIGILFAGFKTDIEKQRQDLAKIQKKEVEYKDTFDRKQKKAANLKKLKEQMKQMEQDFGDLLRQLPNKTEVAGLLVDISQKGLEAGLEFELFKPSGEVPSEFYAELPIQITVVGGYHQFGTFISGVASLPRIVTTHNIVITKEGNRPGGLKMNAIAKTYRALDEEEGG
jgi:type IV pilus assembly protein PilO